MSSFISEHTAEFLLVPQFIHALENRFSEIIPIYFWRTREGSNIAKASFRFRSVKLVAMYPRRPKIASIREEIFEIKFNQILFTRCQHLVGLGIPVFAGVPNAFSIEQLTSQCPCIWFQIKPSGSESIYRAQDDEIIDDDNIQQIEPPLISNIVATEAVSRSWEDALSVMVGMSLQSGVRGLFMGDNYKPVYFILPDGSICR
jgi:hypothetical protein